MFVYTYIKIICFICLASTEKLLKKISNHIQNRAYIFLHVNTLSFIRDKIIHSLCENTMIIT